MPKRHQKCRQKIKSVPAESWGTFVGNCVPHLIAVCVLYTEIKISILFEYMLCFITKLNLLLLLGQALLTPFVPYLGTWREFLSLPFSHCPTTK
jgi:hypothetical protein